MVIMIDPSDREIERTCDHSKVVIAQNAEVEENRVKLKDQSFVMLLK